MIIAKVIPKKNFILHVFTEDKQTGLFDVSPYLNSEAFSPLKEGSNFQQALCARYSETVFG